MNELAETIAKRREQGFGTAQAMVNTDAGRIAMEAVEADIGAIIDAADMRLQARLATAKSLEQRVLLTFLIGSIIAACALIAGAILLARAYRRAASSERLLQATLDSVREGVAAFDADRRLIAWNQTFSRMLKLPRRTLQRREALPVGKTAEIDRFNDYFRDSRCRGQANWPGGTHASPRQQTEGHWRSFITQPKMEAPSPLCSTGPSSVKPRKRCARRRSLRRSAK